jgi:hypothetical protein
VVGRVAFTIRGTLIGKNAAEGTIRLVGRYYRGERQWSACDSLDVAWAVGPRARARLRTVRLGKQVSEYYPAVPSLAVNAAEYVELHTWQLRSLVALGQPPQARKLYDAWLANFRQRVGVERRALILYVHHQRAASRRVLAAYGPLKTRGNLLGQEFGLVRCTSNGDRTPVPVLDDGQPTPLP